MKQHTKKIASAMLLLICFVGIGFLVRGSIRSQSPPRIVVDYQHSSPTPASDMNFIHWALDAYKEAHGKYPPHLTPFLTSPVAYINKIPDDMYQNPPQPYRYFSTGEHWILSSIGPAETTHLLNWGDMNSDMLQRLITDKAYCEELRGSPWQTKRGSLFHLDTETIFLYDSSNGSRSYTGIWDTRTESPKDSSNLLSGLAFDATNGSVSGSWVVRVKQ